MHVCTGESASRYGCVKCVRVSECKVVRSNKAMMRLSSVSIRVNKEMFRVEGVRMCVMSGDGCEVWCA